MSDSVVDEDLGEATIVYETADGTVEKTLPNEHIAYFQDHWMLKTDEDEHGNDIVRRIPIHKVHYVERSVEQFEDEVATLRDQVESFADNLRSRFLGSGEREQTNQGSVDSISIDVDNDSDDANSR
jgi:hypothetical protein